MTTLRRVIGTRRRWHKPSAYFLLCLPVPLVGCGNQIAFELSGVIAENIRAAVSRFGAAPEEGECAPVPNRCGPVDVFGVLVPDCPLGVVCFSQACNSHDLCYAMCGTSRDGCDNAFFEDLTSICARSLAGTVQRFSRCLALAYVYWQSVVRFGQAAFDVSQGHSCACQQSTDRATLSAASRVDGFPRTPPFADRDDDLMPDEWEETVGLDPTDPSDALADFDSDGLVNLQEFIYDTNPFDPAGDRDRVDDAAAAAAIRAYPGLAREDQDAPSGD